MSQEISGETLGMLAELIRRMATGDCDESDVQEGIQALFEGKPFGKSSLSGKVTKFGGFSFTEANFRDRLIYGDIELRRHQNGGGYVPVDQDKNSPDKAYVDDKVYVGPRAMVLGPAKLHDGMFYGGDFNGGVFNGGIFYGGMFYGGMFHGGVFRKTEAVYRDPSKIYR